MSTRLHILKIAGLQATLGEQALQKATEHLKSTIVSTASLEGVIHTDAPKAMHDTSMGTLEHRLEGQPSDDSEASQLPDGDEIPQVADYNAWVHGPTSKSSAQAPTDGLTSRLSKPSD